MDAREQPQPEPKGLKLTPQQTAALDLFEQRLQSSHSSGALFNQRLRSQGIAKAIEQNPFSPSGEGYYTSTPLNRDADFFRQRVHGKVLDVAPAQKEDLKGIVPDGDITYIDKDSYKQNRFVQGDAAKMPFPDATFDTLYTARFLDSVKTVEQFVPEMLRVLKPDGTLIIQPAGGNKEVITGMLEKLKELGIDIEQNVELTVNQNIIQHREEPDLRMEATPRIYITIKR